MDKKYTRKEFVEKWKKQYGRLPTLFEYHLAIRLGKIKETSDKV